MLVKKLCLAGVVVFLAACYHPDEARRSLSDIQMIEDSLPSTLRAGLSDRPMEQFAAELAEVLNERPDWHDISELPYSARTEGDLLIIELQTQVPSYSFPQPYRRDYEQRQRFAYSRYYCDIPVFRRFLESGGRMRVVALRVTGLVFSSVDVATCLDHRPFSQEEFSPPPTLSSVP